MRLFLVALFYTFLSAAASAQTDDAIWHFTASEKRVENGVGYQTFTTTGQDGMTAPMVFLLGGSEGGYFGSSHLAEFVGRGFSVTSMAYFDFDGGPKHLSKIDINAVSSVIDKVSADYGGTSECTAIVGISKGAELALLLAAQTDPAAAYVAVAPTHVGWQASNVNLRTKSSWVLDGEPVPFVRYPWFSSGMAKALRNVENSGDLHKAALRKRKAVENALILVEKISDPVLLQSGRFDRLWPSTEMSDAITARLDAIRPDHKTSHIIYETDHYVFSDASARNDAYDFLYRELRENCAR